MKRKNILKFISLLGVGSFVALSAASCKTEKTVKLTKPTEPKNPNNGGGTTTTNPPSTGGGDTSTTNPGGSTDGSNTMTPSEPANIKKAVEAYVKTLMPDSFKIVNSSDTEIAKDSIKASEVTKENIKLKESNPAIQGWTLGVELVSNSNSSNPENDSIKFKVKFTKENDEVVSNEITLSGFKTLKSSIASVLLKTVSVKDEHGMMVNKTVLDLGSVGFETLVDLNKEGVVKTPASASDAEHAQPQPGERASIVEAEEVSTEQPQPEATQDNTTGLNDKFKTLIDGESSTYKTKLEDIKKTYPDFDLNNLYLSGQAKLVSLWKTGESDWQGNYYLTSKEGDSNKLSIKYKGKDELTIELNDGLVLKDLLPNDVRISASIKNNDKYTKSESNIEAYKVKKESEEGMMGNSVGKRYELSNNDKELKIRITVDRKDKHVDVNPIKLPYIKPGNTDKILFKSEYIFDGVVISDTNFFGNKLIFKKIHDENKGAQQALDSNILNNSGNGVGIFPGRPSVNATEWKTFVPESDKKYFFSKVDSSNEFKDSIHGEDNSKDGHGVVQLAENNETTSNNVNVTKINNDKATTFIIFSRIAYKKAANTFEYYWPNSITILYFAAPTTNASSPSSTSAAPAAPATAGTSSNGK
ncbi:lipoprotein 17-related variable surface protein [Mycoplasma bradburyae]|uniref:lipoprotein 17-related variable surface protein n=1 Tax=Mycoplasma bradburyae TaxID=2963128 RepID=UPI0020CF4833|nr:lipoprotein 17-related variable surface protein [Mycoplasma bradburyae]UTS70540.1 lipoprotein 17-related variable surface protein [Mycoplasma bradburyae]